MEPPWPLTPLSLCESDPPVRVGKNGWNEGKMQQSKATSASETGGKRNPMPVSLKPSEINRFRVAIPKWSPLSVAFIEFRSAVAEQSSFSALPEQLQSISKIFNMDERNCNKSNKLWSEICINQLHPSFFESVILKISKRQSSFRAVMEQFRCQ